jgi:hypothetical protein
MALFGHTNIEVYSVLNRDHSSKKEKESLPWSEMHLNTLLSKQALHGSKSIDVACTIRMSRFYRIQWWTTSNVTVGAGTTQKRSGGDD